MYALCSEIAVKHVGGFMKIPFHAFRAGWTYSSIVNQVDHSQISQELLYGRLARGEKC